MNVCPRCEQPGDVVLRGPREVTVGTVALQVERAPVIDCPDGHDEVPHDAVEAAMAATDATIPRAKRQLLRRREACRSCGAALTMPVRRTGWVVSVDATADLPVLTLRFDLPVIRCPECGTDQLPTRSQEDLVVSVPAVFAAGSPSG